MLLPRQFQIFLKMNENFISLALCDTFMPQRASQQTGLI